MITIKGLLHIYKKEIKTYIVSPTAYVVIPIFLLVAAFYFFSARIFFLRSQASMREFFSALPIIFCIIIPAITMHLFSEEINIGSYEMLLTMPVTFLDIIIGKFLAALTLTAICLFPTFSYAIFISFLGNLDWGPVIGGYISALFLGAAFCAIGLLVSSITKKQIIALVIAILICLFLCLLNLVVILFPVPHVVLSFLKYMDAYIHFQNVARGIVDTRDIIYFISVCFLALYGTKLIMEEKK